MCCYLAGTLNVGINTLIGCSDFDWGQDEGSRRSITRFLLVIDGSPIVWKSKLQTSATISEWNAERTAMVQGVRHAIFIRGLLEEMGFAEERTSWFRDNGGAIPAASKAEFRERTKHVDIKHKCIRGNRIEGANDRHLHEEVADAISNEVN